jgi:hypothetical protein
MLDHRTTDDILPPYMAYPAFLRVVDHFKAEGFPPSILPQTLNAPVTAKYRVVKGLQWLGLVNSADAATDALRELVLHRGTVTWKQALAAMVGRSYSFLAPEYATQTRQALLAAFTAHTGRDNKVLRKSVAFFVGAARDAGMPIHPSLTHSVSISNALAAKSERNAAFAKRRAAIRETGPGVVSLRTATKPMAFAGGPSAAEPEPRKTDPLSKLPSLPPFDPSWSEDMQRRWLEAYNRLLAMGEDG